MSPRKTILRELDQLHDGEGAGRYTRPSAMPGYGGNAAKYQEAVNGLLKDRLIDGKKDEEGRMAVALNPHRIAEVRKELRPWFTRPMTWLVAVAAAGLVAPFLI